MATWWTYAARVWARWPSPAVEGAGGGEAILDEQWQAAS